MKWCNHANATPPSGESVKDLFRICKDFRNKHRLQYYRETRLSIIKAPATTNRNANNPVTVVAPTSIPVHLLQYDTCVAKVCVPDKFDEAGEVKAELFATQFRLYTMLNSHLFPKDHRKLVLSALYSTEAQSRCPKPMTKKFLEGTCICCETG